MADRLPVLLSLLGAAILAGAILLVFTMVVISMINGGIDFPGRPEIADAEAALGGFRLAS